MAYKKTFRVKGIDAEYWIPIVSVDNKFDNTSTVTLALYKDRQAREENPRENFLQHLEVVVPEFNPTIARIYELLPVLNTPIDEVTTETVMITEQVEVTDPETGEVSIQEQEVEQTREVRTPFFADAISDE